MAANAPVGELNHLIIQVARAHRAIALEHLSKLGLHPGQEIILMQLLRQDGQSQTQLAERLGVQAPTVTKMLQRLEVGGFVERRPSSQDNRVTLVYLSAKGRSLEQPLQAAWAALERQTGLDLSDAEQQTLIKLLERLRTNLDGEAEGCC
jgi:MarR family transcriptional regulator, organic hydroperoxide resistance regulator